jgi:hypothetical protein
MSKVSHFRESIHGYPAYYQLIERKEYVPGSWILYGLWYQLEMGNVLQPYLLGRTLVLFVFVVLGLNSEPLSDKHSTT